MKRNDFRVSVKVRNNNILRAAEALGIGIPALAERAGIGYWFLNDLVNMTASPFNRDGRVRWQVERLCLTLGKAFDDLFSQEQCVALESNRSEKEIDAEQVFALMSGAAVDGISHDDGLSGAVTFALGELSDQERKVIELRFGFDGGVGMTLEEVGKQFDVTCERIRQIEAKALRKLRHPSRKAMLLDFVSEAA